MTLTFRNYQHETDYQRVSDFLITHYRPGNLDGNWLEPAWEYAHFHPLLDSSSLGKFGIWQEDGEIVSVVHYGWYLGEAFFQFHPQYRHLRAEMLDYAETALTRGVPDNDRRYLCAYVNDNDPQFNELVQSRGYVIDPDETQPMYQLNIPHNFPPIHLPQGFHLISLAEECDWGKVHRVMWQGFNHGDDPAMTSEELESRRRMFDTPKARRDLKIIVTAPDGDYASICGMFYEPTRRYAYVEPVATVPIYRHLGLGKAAVLEGIRRCAALGAEIAYVGSDQAFYQSMGFTKVHNTEGWVKYFE